MLGVGGWVDAVLSFETLFVEVDEVFTTLELGPDERRDRTDVLVVGTLLELLLVDHLGDVYVLVHPRGRLADALPFFRPSHPVQDVLEVVLAATTQVLLLLVLLAALRLVYLLTHLLQ